MLTQGHSKSFYPAHEDFKAFIKNKKCCSMALSSRGTGVIDRHRGFTAPGRTNEEGACSQVDTAAQQTVQSLNVA